MSGYISPDAKIGKNCHIAPSAIIKENVRLDDGCTVGDYCILGEPHRDAEDELNIGSDSTIRSHTVMYTGSSFGPRLSTGHHCLIREGIRAGINLQIGSFNSLEGLAVIGDYVRLHSNVNIGRGSTLGDLIWIFPNVVLTNDPLPPSGLLDGVTVSDGAVICTNALVLPGADIGVGAFIAANSRASGKITVGAYVSGPAGKTMGDLRLLRHFPTRKRHPWMDHFSDYYPDEAQDKIRAIKNTLDVRFAEIDKARKQANLNKV